MEPVIPIISIPIGIVAALLVLIGLVGGLLAGWLLARRGAETISDQGRVDARWLSDLLGALPYAALLSDAEGRVRLANDRARRWLETDVHPVIYPAVVPDLIRRVAASGIAEGIEVPVPGKECPMWAEACSLGQGEDILVLIRDASDDRASDQVYRRLVQTVSHELRTPLTAIIGHTDILASCAFEEEALWRRSQQFISREAERLARLVEDLLVLTRLDRQAPLLTPVNLRAIAEEAISALWHSAEERGVSLGLRAAESLPRVRADADRLQRVFTNLLDNAVKYTPAGGQVTVELAPRSGYVHAAVADTGMGVAPHDLPYIFEPLFRGERAAQTEPGSGLGLVIVRTILAQHGVEVDVKSSPGEGTVFSFDLPAAP
jgi:signal transduction histidine kinase